MDASAIRSQVRALGVAAEAGASWMAHTSTIETRNLEETFLVRLRSPKPGSRRGVVDRREGVYLVLPGQLRSDSFANGSSVGVLVGEAGHCGLHYSAHFLHRGGAGFGHSGLNCLLNFFVRSGLWQV